jgi:surfeit locus 1 family protein
MTRKFPLIPTAFSFFGIILLLTLGTWQVQRLNWKNHLIAQIAQRALMPPVTLEPGKIDIESLKYRKIIVKGHFLNDKEVHLFTGAKQMRGEPGYDIITPVEQADGTIILVDRGWVPANKKNPSLRPETLINGEILITGMLQSGELPGIFTPENNPERNLWFWLDIPKIASFTGKTIGNVYVRALAGADDEGKLPMPGKANIEIRNDHLEYAIIWYSLAVILSVIYLIYVREQGLGVRPQGRKKSI